LVSVFRFRFLVRFWFLVVRSWLFVLGSGLWFSVRSQFGSIVLLNERPKPQTETQGFKPKTGNLTPKTDPLSALSDCTKIHAAAAPSGMEQSARTTLEGWASPASSIPTLRAVGRVATNSTCRVVLGTIG
jgi:hypothetical protein